MTELNTEPERSGSNSVNAQSVALAIKMTPPCFN
jgi:hypothetical protein